MQKNVFWLIDCYKIGRECGAPCSKYLLGPRMFNVQQRLRACLLTDKWGRPCSCLNCRGDWTLRFLNPLTHSQIMYGVSAILHTYDLRPYITISFRLRPSKSSTPLQLIFHNSNAVSMTSRDFKEKLTPSPSSHFVILLWTLIIYDVTNIYCPLPAACTMFYRDEFYRYLNYICYQNCLQRTVSRSTRPATFGELATWIWVFTVPSPQICVTSRVVAIMWTPLFLSDCDVIYERLQWMTTV